MSLCHESFMTLNACFADRQQEQLHACQSHRERRVTSRTIAGQTSCWCWMGGFCSSAFCCSPLEQLIKRRMDPAEIRRVVQRHWRGMKHQRQEIIRNMSNFLSELFRAAQLTAYKCVSGCHCSIIYACRPLLTSLGADTDALLDHSPFNSVVLALLSWGYISELLLGPTNCWVHAPGAVFLWPSRLLFSLQTIAHLPWCLLTEEVAVVEEEEGEEEEEEGEVQLAAELVPPLRLPAAPPPPALLPTTPPRGHSSPPPQASAIEPPPPSASPSWSPPAARPLTPTRFRTPTRKLEVTQHQCWSLQQPRNLPSCLPRTSAVRGWQLTYRGPGRSKARQPNSPAL